MVRVCLVVAVGVGSAASVSQCSSQHAPASLSPKSLVFGNQTVGTTSSPRTVTLTNGGATTLEDISISVPSNFAQTNTCGTSLAVRSKCTISLTFTPVADGSVGGSLSVGYDGTGSPQSVSLSGNGTGGVVVGAVGCFGAPITQLQADVTSQLSYANIAAGVNVSQLTDNGQNRFYYFDVPAYSPAVNGILYIDFVAGNEMTTSTPGGTGAQIISPTATEPPAFFTGDGQLAYYAKPVSGGAPGGMDMFGIFVNTTGACQELRFTNLDERPLTSLAVWEISPSSPDPAGGYDIAFSPDLLLHRVQVMANGTSQLLPTITLNDPESAATFHRLRMNPKFPNIVMYKRNAVGASSAQPEIWLVDLNTCIGGTCTAGQIINVIQNLKAPPKHQPKGGHINWSPDGLDLAFDEPDIADYWIVRNAVNPDGTINTNFTLQELGPFKMGAMFQTTAGYCAFPPDWPAQTVLACLAGPGSPANAGMLYLMSSDGTGTTKFLASTDAQVLTINGTPMPQFAQDDEHVMFNSDRTGIPQIYIISGYTLSVP
jgi:Abnormal spindle-like microcephaly-assoc'd, ASPM-SPD-2-Hydin